VPSFDHIAKLAEWALADKDYAGGLLQILEHIREEPAPLPAPVIPPAEPFERSL
jgi:hypothetical protein